MPQFKDRHFRLAKKDLPGSALTLAYLVIASATKKKCVMILTPGAIVTKAFRA
jgi:hypothetical protein